MESIVKLEKMGYIFTINDNDLGIDFITGSIPNPLEADRLINNITKNKGDAIEFIKHKEDEETHTKAMEAEYLPYEYVKCYGKQLTSKSYVFIHKINDAKIWTGYRITYNQDDDIVSEKIIVEDKNFNIVFHRVETYVKNYMDFINKIKAY